MIKRSPQDIADFTGCWVAQTPTGHWFIAKKSPLLRSYGWFIHNENRYDLPEEVVDVPEGHSWEYLYEPQGNQGKSEGDLPNSTDRAESDNKAAPYSEKPADSDNKHQSQVHVHSEYDVVYGGYPAQLSIKVTQLMHEGWKPLGGVAVEDLEEKLDDHRCIFYQAMVRGLE